MKGNSDLKVIVTGGTGLVGTRLLYDLIEKGYQVKALKRANSDLTKVSEVFSFYGNKEAFKAIEWVEGDLTDIFSLIDAFKGVDYVFHAAALVSFQPKDKYELFAQNYRGTQNVVDACIECKVKKLAYVSSVATMGKEIAGKAIDEESEWSSDAASSNYSMSKYLAELEVYRGIEEGLPAVMINPAIIFAPGRNNQSSSSLFGAVVKGLKFYTKGSNAFTDVRDVSRVLIQLLESNRVGERFIIHSGNYSYKKILELLAISLNKPVPNVIVNPVLMNLARRIFRVISIITGKNATITKETVASSNSNKDFSNAKIKRELEVRLTPIEQTIKDFAPFYLQKNN